MVEIVVKAIIEIIDSLMGLFHLGHWGEKRMARDSRIGESKLDKDARNWQEKIICSWWFLYLIISLVLGVLGFGAWVLWD